METSILYVIKAFILPPGINIVICICGYYLLKKNNWAFGKFLMFISLVSLYLLSTTYISSYLASKIETTPPLVDTYETHTDREVIIVLGGGRHVSMPEYGQALPQAKVLERLRYAMRIQRKTSLPILISGGRVFPKSESEASIMARVLKEDFLFDAQWLEEESHNTAENAENSFEILKKDNITKIYLVTHAWHMNRAASIFESKGFDVVPAPTIYYSAGTNMPEFIQWLPKSDALDLSRNILHEMVGHWWYRFRHH